VRTIADAGLDHHTAELAFLSEMSPQEYTRGEIARLAEREARTLLHVSLPEAFKLLDRGALAGTAAEAEMSMFRFLLNG
jgi:hypothetical protein